MKTRSGGNPMKVKALALAVSVACGAVWAEGGKQYFDIQTDQVGEALKAFAIQSDSEILFAAAVVNDKKTSGLTGEYTEDEALERILEGTGLKAKKTRDNVFLVQARAGKKKLIENQGFNGKEPSLKSTYNKSDSRQMEEVVVTANKREQKIQDVAMSITALGMEEIERKSLVSMADYLNTVPGVTMLDAGTGRNQLVIRGIGLGLFEQSTVSTYMGEVPLTNPVTNGSTDMKLVDMDRIEVLRGPQGTLYGSGAMGGTVRNVPVAPNLDQAEGKIQLGYSTVAQSSDDNSQLIAVANLPLIEEQLALRVAGYRYDYAGYVDRVSTPFIENVATTTDSTVDVTDDIGSQTYTGGRATLLWRASDRLELVAMLATQKLEDDGRNRVDISSGGYTQVGLTGGQEFYEDIFNVANIVLKYDLDWATLTTSSTWFDGEWNNRTDIAEFGWAATSEAVNDKKAFVGEIRLSSQLVGPIQYVGGLYYESFDYNQDAVGTWYGSPETQFSFLGTDPVYLISKDERRVDQKAIFGEVIYTANPKWEFTLGGRWFDYRRQDDFSRQGAFAQPSTEFTTNERDTNFKVNASYIPNEDTLIYAQWSQGFRLGKGQSGPNPTICDTDNDGNLDFTDVPVDPGALSSDTTNNYEIGGKFAMLDNRLVVNAAIYRIDWIDLPIQIPNTQPAGGPCAASTVTINGGEARSQGVELETRYFVTPDLQLLLSGAYIDTQFLDDSIGSEGDRLPMTPRTTGSLGLQYDFSLGGRDSFLRTDYSYVGDFFTDIGRVSPESGDYVKWNMRAGMKVNNYSIQLYGNNLTNEDELATVDSPNRGWRMTPRTIGIGVDYQF